MRILDESLKSNDKTILFLGSANVKDERNPYSFEKREEFINLLYFDNKDLTIEDLDDLESDKGWVKQINTKLLKYINFNEKIIFY
jgi:nicotinamide mononucleotide adenylyltransferase